MKQKQQFAAAITGFIIFFALSYSSFFKEKPETIPPNNPTKAIVKKKTPSSKNTAQIIEYNKQFYNTYTVDLESSAIKMYYKSKTNNRLGTFQNLKTHVAGRHQKLIFATNGGMFQANGHPLGLYVEEGKQIQRLNLRSAKTNFYIKPNGVFYINKDSTAGIIDSKKYHSIKEEIQYATQSGPMLLVNGEVNSKLINSYKTEKIRSGVGLISPTKVVFAISTEGVIFYDFAMLFKEEFRCKEALFLDGAISEMYLPSLGRNDLGGNFGAIIGVTE